MAGSDDEDFAALFAASEGERTRERRVAAGDVVRGRVIAVGATAAFVAVGGKAEAPIELGEFRDPETGDVQLHEGDEIEATVVDDGTRSGSIVLKRVAGRGGHVPGELEQAFAHGIAIESLVTGENKGGYDVQIGSVRAFCPGSQIAAGPTDNGGPTHTIALQAGSPAISAGNQGVCGTALVHNLDQRGFLRPGVGARTWCMGAYEFNSPGSPPVP